MQSSRSARAVGHRHDMQATYRYLRLAIILLTLLLTLSVIVQIAADDGAVLRSVSAYYYTPARDVFVASLCAIGACMIIYRGRSDTEDVLLNLSGYLAFFVAFVPTSPAHIEAEPRSGAFIPENFITAATQNTWAVLAAGLAGFVIEIAALPQRERQRGSRSGIVVLVAGGVAYLGLAAYFLFARDSFFIHGHGVAAVLLFIGVVGVVGVNATAHARCRAEDGLTRRRQWANWYGVGFAGMLVTALVVLGPVRMLVPQWLFVLEAALIGQFLIFWIIQTVERWHAPTIRADALMPG
ncbi:MAG TPA: hypothetical protein VK095_16610 [Beutenbergiaceae bacterium]|nr:hypothetical protein [Beutenbergiaceae bacterium]